VLNAQVPNQLPDLSGDGGAAGRAVAGGSPGTTATVAAGVATEAENSTNPTYDNNTGYLTVDFEGVYALSVVAETLGSASAGAAINTGDAIYASGGTYDKTSGITYGFTLCKDTNGTFFGRAMQSLAAGTTATIAVLLRNSA
jgi:hypothetical protein